MRTNRLFYLLIVVGFVSTLLIFLSKGHASLADKALDNPNDARKSPANAMENPNDATLAPNSAVGRSNDATRNPNDARKNPNDATLHPNGR